MRRWLVGSALVTCVVLALGCSGAEGEKLGELLGDSTETLNRGLTVEQLESLPSLQAVDLTQPLTAADYTLWQNNMQAVLVGAGGCEELGLTSDQINLLVNRYRFDVGKLTADLTSGAKTPEEMLNFLATIRTAVVSDLGTEILTGEGQAEFNEFWSHNEDFWRQAGFPGGPTELGADAVRELNITGPQAAQFIELFVKATIDFSRVLHPGATNMVAIHQEAAPPTHEQIEQAEALGQQYWESMMAILTPEQVAKAWPWYRNLERKFSSIAMAHHGERDHHAVDQTASTGVAAN